MFEVIEEEEYRRTRGGPGDAFFNNSSGDWTSGFAKAERLNDHGKEEGLDR